LITDQPARAGFDVLTANVATIRHGFEVSDDGGIYISECGKWPSLTIKAKILVNVPSGIVLTHGCFDSAESVTFFNDLLLSLNGRQWEFGFDCILKF
jgi:hypothetical protein